MQIRSGLDIRFWQCTTSVVGPDELPNKSARIIRQLSHIKIVALKNASNRPANGKNKRENQIPDTRKLKKRGKFSSI